MEVQNLQHSVVPEALMLKAEYLIRATWPEAYAEKATEAEMLNAFKSRTPNKVCHFIIEEDKVIGYAESFPRKITTSKGERTILGLGAVCVDTAQRGRGLGALVVTQAFNRLPEGEIDTCLFQTGVPQFYKKLNCRLINNQIVNSLNQEKPEANPFWDDYIMIFPKEISWPEGKIDLLGKGY